MCSKEYRNLLGNNSGSIWCLVNRHLLSNNFCPFSIIFLYLYDLLKERKGKNDRIRRQMRCLENIIFFSDIIGDIKWFSCWCRNGMRTFCHITCTTITWVTAKIPRRIAKYLKKNFGVPKYKRSFTFRTMF